MATSGLRQLTERDLAIINRYSAQHGRVLRATTQTADSAGGIAVPLVRLGTLVLLERRGTISRAEAEAGERFNSLFQRAHLDALHAADMGRVAISGAPIGRDLSPSGERCRKRVADAIAALGGHGSVAASAIWHVCGLEWPVSRWSLTVRRSHEQGAGILCGALPALAAHFAGRR